MVLFFWNVLLALAWAVATGEITLSSLLFGFAFGYAALWVAQPALGRSQYFSRLPRAVRFAMFFLWEMLLANLRVAYDVVTPRYHMRPGIIAIPLEADTDLEITILAGLITLTPGTLSLDVSEDRRFLYVHAMFVDDVQRFREGIKNGYEKPLLELIR